MFGTFHSLLNFILKILPGIVIVLAIFIIMKPQKKLRIILYIFSFVLIRDAMTPLNLWFLGEYKGLLWIRLSEDPLFLILFGIFSLFIVVGLYLLDKENREYLKWFKENKLIGILIGIVGCVLVVLPFFVFYKFINIDLRGGIVQSALMLPLLVFALFGNLFEETLFRGYVIGCIDSSKSMLYKGFLSGVIFSLCHIFLAITVTDIGTPLLVFTLWEGVIVGAVGVKYGIIPATLTHGGAIFLLSSGLL
ncbi:MAG: CPBP family intramembrane metalloprotease [Spirochaetales bacterium]|nr:CPBP family intramembrane metalloprotease [Spirochaetales bacterium]